MESETSTFCGRRLTNTKALPEGWNPDDHPDCVCPVCMNWYRRVVKPCHTGKVDKKEVVKTL
jgi:hypothetical protein